jgi:hypothetical protein
VSARSVDCVGTGEPESRAAARRSTRPRSSHSTASAWIVKLTAKIGMISWTTQTGQFSVWVRSV